MRNNLSSSKNIFQYIYSNIFPEIYCSTERRGFDLKSNFHIIFKTYKDKKKLEASLGKNPCNHEEIWNETCMYEENHVKSDDFNEAEEKEVKERIEKRKQQGREVAQNNQLLKKMKKIEDNQKKEKEMFKRLDKLNQEYREIKNFSKNSRKMSKSIL